MHCMIISLFLSSFDCDSLWHSDEHLVLVVILELSIDGARRQLLDLVSSFEVSTLDLFEVPRD